MALKAPKAVLFDWDNTLVDTWPVIHKALYVTFEQLGKTPWTLEEAKIKVGRSMRDAFPALFGENWLAAADLYRASYRAINIEHLIAFPDVDNTLKYLQERNIPIALVSNKMGDTLRKEVEHLGWGHYFEASIGAADAEHDKPHPAPVYLALESIEVTAGKDEIWFIGDSEVDLQVAHNAALTPILYGGVNAEDVEGLNFRGVKFDYHVDNHLHMQKLLNETL